MRLTTFFAVSVCFFIFGAVFVGAEEKVIDFKDLYEGDLAVDGFELKSKTGLSIHAIGAEMKNSHDMFAYGWILDAETREPIWVLSDEDTRRYSGSKYVREFEGEITLPTGRYEAYYYIGQPYYYGDININIDNLDDVGDIIARIFDSDDKDKLHEYYSEDVEDLMFVIEAPEESFVKFNPVTSETRSPIIDFRQPEDDFSEKKGFTLKKDMNLKIVAIGEYISSDRVFVDFGWIINAETRERVWKMDKWNTSWSGGGRKNRGFNGELKLPAGNYVAYYMTDDSHSFGDWNVMPPYDPLSYGLAIFAADESDAANISSFVDEYSEPVIVRLDRVRDDEYLSKGFTLKEGATIHIIALGEYGYQDEFVDYGWIESIDNDEVVWEMTEDNTDHAGGASKNRRFDGIVTLPAGNYMVHYISDDSHSYRRWNASPPFDKNMWGIAVFGGVADFDESQVETFDEAPVGSNVIVSITGVGDSKEISRSFRLDGAQKVHIFALGEGRGGQMYDYGWIEREDDNDIIWEMTYRKTRHAGGDRKNRLVDTDIFLEAGEYSVYYVTDGSHSFPEFNASRPNRPEKWGITITKGTK